VENADFAEKTLMALIFFLESHLPLRAVQGSATISAYQRHLRSKSLVGAVTWEPL